MSEANLEIVQRGIDAFNRRDVEALEALSTNDFVWYPALPGAVEGGSYHGRDGIERYFAESRDTWDELQVLCDRLRDLGDRVLAFRRVRGRGKSSGVEVDAMLAFIVDLRNGEITRVRTYLDHDDALKPLGSRSKLCPRNSTSFARSTRRGRVATLAPPSGRTPRSRA